MKKTIAIMLAIIVLIVTAVSTYSYNPQNQATLVLQFGKIVACHENPGIFFKAPIIHSLTPIYTGENMYDIKASEVITSDKKTMIADCYVTWKVADVKTYYATVSSKQTAESRIDVAVFNGLKNSIGSLPQEKVISGKDGSLAATIIKNISSLEKYGIEITSLEIKTLDLPQDNKEAVYQRMRSERKAIAAQHTADGNKTATEKRAETDAQARTIISNAEAEAAKIIAQGESEYFRITAESYSGNEQKKEFYSYIIKLEAMKKTLKNGGTYIIDETSPIYDIINNN